MPDPRIIRNEILQSIMFLLLSIVALVITKAIAVNTGSFKIAGVEYNLLTAAMESAKRNTVWHFAMSFCLACGGTLLALFILYHGYWRSKVRYTPSLVFYWAAVLMLAFLGGVNTLRFLSWASPVVLILIAHLAEKLWNDLPAGSARTFARLFLIISALYYVIMIHPFEGYFDDYTAWRYWGGLQFSYFRSIKYLVPCLAILVGFVAVGRKLIPEGRGNAEQENPPYPEPAVRV